jgi:hypothetical protein
MSGKSGPWTIGVELEFLYARIRDKTATEFSLWYCCLDELHQLLSQRGLHCNVHPYPDVPLDFSEWNITTDSSVGSSRLGKGEEGLLGLSAIDESHYWDVRAVELISPPLSAPQSYNLVSIDPTTALLREWLAALRIKRSTDSGSRRAVSDDAKNEPLTTLTNQQCGFHVHVGVDPSFDKTSELECSIPLPVLQQFAMLQLRFELVFSQLHSLSRREDAKYCLRNSISF